MDRPRRNEFADLRQLVEKQLRGPVLDNVRGRITRWNDPLAKLARQQRRAAAVMWFFLFLAFVAALAGGAVLIGIGDEMSINQTGQLGAVVGAGVLTVGFGALGIKSGLRLRRLNRTELPAAAPSLPAARSSARKPMERLAEAERALQDLLRQLSSPRAAVPAESVEHARETGAEAASALREVAAQLQAVERAAELAPAADQAALRDGIERLRDQLDQGLEGYGSLIAAAGKLVAASSGSGPDREGLTDATDRLHGLAVALREIFPDRA